MIRKIQAASIAVFMFLAFMPFNVNAQDYQSMSTEELSNLRGTMYRVSQEEKDAFRAEWTKRLQAMSAEEKQKYLGPGQGRGKGNRLGVGLGDGSGRGKGGSGYGTGGGNGRS